MSDSLRVIFAGTPEFAAEALAKILAAGHTVPLVLTQPDRPAGRGMKLQASAVKQLAVQYNIPVAQPLSLRLDGKYPDDAAAAQAAIAEAKADVMVVAAYGLILPQWTLDLPPRGCLNIHASLLPRWRGAARRSCSTAVVSVGKMGSLRTSSMSPVSRPASICMMTTPVCASPASMAR